MLKGTNKDYNTSRTKLIMREYGRNIQQMIEHANTIEDPEKRKRAAQTIIDLMGQMNPHLRDIADFKHKLWDHLFIISDFKLDVDSPFPKPDPKMLKAKSKKMPYQKNKIMLKQYGKNIEMMVEKSKSMEEGPKKQSFIEIIANFMKSALYQWQKENVNDETIFENLKTLSKGAIDLSKGSLVLSEHKPQEKRPRSVSSRYKRPRK